MSGPRFHTVRQSATGAALERNRAASEFRQRFIHGLKKEKKNPTVVVEAVETGEIAVKPCAYRRSSRELPGDGIVPFVETCPISPVSPGWGNWVVAIGRVRTLVFPRRSDSLPSLFQCRLADWLAV